MEHENIIRKLERLVSEAEALAKEKNSPVEIDEDPRICALMLQAEPLIEELDQIALEMFRSNPEKLAWWKKIMEMDEEE